MAVLEAINLRKRYGERFVVDGLSLSVNAGEILGLLGPNGAGKSTTMSMLAGLVEPTEGEVRFLDQPFSLHNRQLRARLGMAPQDLAIYPDLTARENLEFFGQIYGISGSPLRQRVEQLLHEVGLESAANQRSDEFSGGMKRRLNFAVAILHEPALLMLDEPTVGVDPQSRAHLLACAQQLASRGTAILYASHYMEEIETLCKRIAIIDHGKLLVQGTLSDLIGGYAERVTLTLSSRFVPTDHTVHATVSSDGLPQIEIIAPSVEWSSLLPRVLQQLRLAGVTITRIETPRQSLEQVFLDLTGRRLRD